MKYSLVGYTGFVGGNLAEQHPFDHVYNSSNIQDAYTADNGFVVYSGMTAEKFLANKDPEADLAKAQQAMENIRKMRPEKLVLISTVDVYPRPIEVFEDTPIQDDNAPAYGKNRLALEGWVRQEYPDALIVRLPGLFGKGLKKNFIFDMLTLTPGALTEAKYAELCPKNAQIQTAYQPDGTGFYRLQPLPLQEKQALRVFFEKNDFNALAFTDSRSVFQFYNLAHLWADIGRCLKAGIRLANFATEPIEAAALYRALYGAPFKNETKAGPVHYDMRTRYGCELGGCEGYMARREDVMRDIVRFVSDQVSGRA